MNIVICGLLASIFTVLVFIYYEVKKMNKIEFADTKNPEPTPKGIEYLHNLARDVIVEENNQIEKAIVSIVNNYGDKHILVNAKMIAEAIDKQEKYRWHDLRKDPNDLPFDKVMSSVFVAWVGSSHLWHDTMFFYYDDRAYFSLCDCRHSIIGSEKFGNEGQVVAWRYIEPFEEEEK